MGNETEPCCHPELRRRQNRCRLKENGHDEARRKRVYIPWDYANCEHGGRSGFLRRQQLREYLYILPHPLVTQRVRAAVEGQKRGGISWCCLQAVGRCKHRYNPWMHCREAYPLLATFFSKTKSFRIWPSQAEPQTCARYSSRRALELSSVCSSRWWTLGMACTRMKIW